MEKALMDSLFLSLIGDASRSRLFLSFLIFSLHSSLFSSFHIFPFSDGDESR